MINVYSAKTSELFFSIRVTDAETTGLIYCDANFLPIGQPESPAKSKAVENFIRGDKTST